MKKLLLVIGIVLAFAGAARSQFSAQGGVRITDSSITGSKLTKAIWDSIRVGYSAGSISLSQITQSAATTGQIPAWSGSAWVPTTRGTARWDTAATKDTVVLIASDNDTIVKFIRDPTNDTTKMIVPQGVFVMQGGAAGIPSFDSLKIDSTYGYLRIGNRKLPYDLLDSIQVSSKGRFATLLIDSAGTGTGMANVGRLRLKKGTNVTLAVVGDTVTIAASGGAGSGTPVYADSGNGTPVETDTAILKEGSGITVRIATTSGKDTIEVSSTLGTSVDSSETAASNSLRRNCVDSLRLADGSVTTIDLKDSLITGGKVATAVWDSIRAGYNTLLGTARWDTLHSKDTVVLMATAGDTLVKFIRDATNDTTKMIVPTGILVIQGGSNNISLFDSLAIDSANGYLRIGNDRITYALWDSIVDQRGAYQMAAGSGKPIKADTAGAGTATVAIDSLVIKEGSGTRLVLNVVNGYDTLTINSIGIGTAQWDTTTNRNTIWARASDNDTIVKFVRDATNDTTFLVVPTGVLVIKGGAAGIPLFDSLQVDSTAGYIRIGNRKVSYALWDSLVSTDKGRFATVLVDSAGTGTGMATVGRLRLKKGSNVTLSVVGDTVTVAATGGAGSGTPVYADTGDAQPIIAMDTMILGEGTGVSLYARTTSGKDTLRISATLGTTIELGEMSNNSVDSLKVVDASLSTSDMKDSLMTGVKLATAVWDSIRIGYTKGKILRSGTTSFAYSDSLYIQAGQGITLNEQVVYGFDTMTITNVLGTTIDSTEMSAGLTALRNASVDSNKAVSMSALIKKGSLDSTMQVAGLGALRNNSVDSNKIVAGLGGSRANSVDSLKVVDSSLSTADLKDSLLTGRKLSRVIWDSIRAGYNSVAGTARWDTLSNKDTVQIVALGGDTLLQLIRDHTNDTTKIRVPTGILVIQGGSNTISLFDSVAVDSQYGYLRIGNDRITYALWDSIQDQKGVYAPGTGGGGNAIKADTAGAGAASVLLDSLVIKEGAGTRLTINTVSGFDTLTITAIGIGTAQWDTTSNRNTIWARASDNDTIVKFVRDVTNDTTYMTVPVGVLVIKGGSNGIPLFDSLQIESTSGYIRMSNTKMNYALFDSIVSTDKGRFGTLVIDSQGNGTNMAAVGRLRLKEGSNMTISVAGDTVTLASAAGGGSGNGSADLDTVLSKDSVILIGAAENYLSVKNVGGRTRITPAANDTLEIYATTLLIGQPGYTKLDSLIMGDDTLKDFRGWGMMVGAGRALGVDSNTVRIKVDTTGVGGVGTLTFPVVLREGGNVTLNKVGADTIVISASGGSGSGKLLKVGSLAYDIADSLFFKAGDGITLTGTAPVGYDTLTIASAFGATIDSTDMTSGLGALRNGSVDSNKAVSMSALIKKSSLDSTMTAAGLGLLRRNSVDSLKIVAAGIRAGNLRDSLISGDKLATAVWDSIRLGYIGGGKTIRVASVSLDKADSVFFKEGVGITMTATAYAGFDTLTIWSTLGATVDSAEMTAGLTALRNGSVDSLKIVNGTIRTANLRDSLVTGVKLAKAVWDSIRIGYGVGVAGKWDTGSSKDIVWLKASNLDTIVKFVRDTANDTTYMTVPTGVLVIKGGSSGIPLFDSLAVNGYLRMGTKKMDSTLFDSLIDQRGRFAVSAGGGKPIKIDTAGAGAASVLVDSLVIKEGSVLFTLNTVSGFDTLTVSLKDSAVTGAKLATAIWDSIRVGYSGGTPIATANFDTLATKDTAILIGATDTLLKIQRMGAEHVRIGGGSEDTLELFATVLILGQPGYTKIDSLILGTDTVKDLTGWGATRYSTSLGVDSLVIALKVDSAGNATNVAKVHWPTILQEGTGAILTIKNGDTITFATTLGTTVDSSEMASGLNALRNGSVDSLKIVNGAIASADLKDSIVTGAKVATAVWDSVRIGYSKKSFEFEVSYGRATTPTDSVHLSFPYWIGDTLWSWADSTNQGSDTEYVWMTGMPPQAMFADTLYYVLQTSSNADTTSGTIGWMDSLTVFTSKAGSTANAMDSVLYADGTLRYGNAKGTIAIYINKNLRYGRPIALKFQNRLKSDNAYVRVASARIIGKGI